MAFRFRLAKVLHHRKSLEDLARKNFLEAQANLKAAENILQDYFNQIQNSQEERHELVRKGGPTSEKLCQIHEYIKGTEVKIKRQKIVIEEHQVKVEKLQLALQEAAIDYKMIEKLEERQSEEYRNKLKKLEQKSYDEMANSRFNLRRKYE